MNWTDILIASISSIISVLFSILFNYFIVTRFLERHQKKLLTYEDALIFFKKLELELITLDSIDTINKLIELDLFFKVEKKMYQQFQTVYSCLMLVSNHLRIGNPHSYDFKSEDYQKLIFQLEKKCRIKNYY